MNSVSAQTSPFSSENAAHPSGRAAAVGSRQTTPVPISPPSNGLGIKGIGLGAVGLGAAAGIAAHQLLKKRFKECCSPVRTGGRVKPTGTKIVNATNFYRMRN